MIDNTISSLLGLQVGITFGRAQDHEGRKPILLLQVQFGVAPCGSNAKPSLHAKKSTSPGIYKPGCPSPSCKWALMISHAWLM